MFKNFLCLGNMLLITVVAFSQRQQDRINYVERYKDIAISEMERAGVPASIKLAQAILESNAGKSVLARKAKNHFGMKCGPAWEGKTFYREDDDYDDGGNLIESCFRVYNNPEASFIAHSEFLRDPRKTYRYGFLFDLDPKDYRQWAYGLKRAGYATNPNYPQLLIRLIEDYELFQYDDRLIAPDIIDDLPPLLAGSGIFLINDVKVLLAEEGDTPEKVADRTGVAIKRLLKYNETLDSPNEKIKEESRVYLQRKRNSFRGKKKWHHVEEGETMFSISQLYGIRLSKLYKKNRMEPGTEPAVGERIKLRWWVKKGETPRLRSQGPRPGMDNDDELEMDEEDQLSDPALPDISTTFNKDNISGIDTPDDNRDLAGSSTSDKIKLQPVVGSVKVESSTENFNPNYIPPPVPLPSDAVINNPDLSGPNLPAPDQANKFHKVNRGDTLYSIARKYGITVEDIKRLNNLTSDLIRSGWMLRIAE